MAVAFLVTGLTDTGGLVIGLIIGRFDVVTGGGLVTTGVNLIGGRVVVLDVEMELGAFDLGQQIFAMPFSKPQRVAALLRTSSGPEGQSGNLTQEYP